MTRVSAIDHAFADAIRAVVGASFVHDDEATRTRYGADALKRGTPADLVVRPGTSSEVAAIARLCHDARVPLVPRGAGTGYTGGAVPVHGGVVLSLERFTRILDIDEANLLAVVQPAVITGDLQDAVERVGLFYPPDPASLRESSIGGNVAECAGGPRAFKYGTTRRYILGLEAVLATGEIVRTGGKTVKNVVGYDLTQLLVGSEGTLAIVTEIVVRLVPKPVCQAALRATFARVSDAVDAVALTVRARVVPAAVELVDRVSLDALPPLSRGRTARAGRHRGAARRRGGRTGGVGRRGDRAGRGRLPRGARPPKSGSAQNEAERQEVWRVRRELSYALRTVGAWKYNHDVVVPKGRIPELFALVERLRAESGLLIPCFGHVGDGNIHVNIMVEQNDEATRRPRRADRARALRRRRRARRVRDRRARHRLREGAVPAARGVARDDCADEARQAGVRSGRDPQSGEDLSGVSAAGLKPRPYLDGPCRSDLRRPRPSGRRRRTTDSSRAPPSPDPVRARGTAACVRGRRRG